MLKSHGFNQLIDQPTRVAECSSVLDHIICNSSEKISQSGVLPIGLSDHFLTFCTRKTVKQKYDSYNTVTIRSMKNYTASSYQEYLAYTNWAPVYQSSDPNTAWSHFKVIFTQVLDQLVPHKCIQIKQRSEKWMTQEILVILVINSYEPINAINLTKMLIISTVVYAMKYKGMSKKLKLIT